MTERPVLKFRRAPGSEDLPLPRYMTAGASGCDLPAFVEDVVVIPPGGRAMIPTGFYVEIPPGYEGQVRPRSGLAAKHGVTVLNAPGTIDADYRGMLTVVLVNLGDEDFVVRRGDRIAQLVIAPVVQAQVQETQALSDTQRGESGFGHTGMNSDVPS